METHQNLRAISSFAQILGCIALAVSAFLFIVGMITVSSSSRFNYQQQFQDGLGVLQVGSGLALMGSGFGLALIALIVIMIGGITNTNRPIQ